MDREWVRDVPAGLVRCRIGSLDAHIAALSPAGLLLRTAAPVESGAPIRLTFYHPESGGLETHTISDYQTGQARRENGAVLTRFSFDDSACASAVRRALNSYARYVELRSEWGASACGREFTGYPLEEDEVFPPSLAEARRAWFSALPPLRPPQGTELALCLNCRELYALYLAHPLPGFISAYARARSIPREVLPPQLPQRLYIGNEHCRLLFPDDDTLRALLKKARSEGLEVTLVTADLCPGEEERADSLLALAREAGLEVEVNDWGMLARAADLPDRPALLLGTRLNRRRKDPRMKWKAALPGREELLSRNALNDGPWRAFLRELGVSRFEYESCGLPTVPAGGPCSLHLPFYQTNSSRWCTLRALCESGDRGMQAPAAACPGWCGENALLYPSHLKLLGRFNSLLALDDGFQRHDRGFDRWVLNF